MFFSFLNRFVVDDLVPSKGDKSPTTNGHPDERGELFSPRGEFNPPRFVQNDVWRGLRPKG
jgi:hypothetical protein